MAIDEKLKEVYALEFAVHTEVMGAEMFLMRRDTGYVGLDGLPFYTEVIVPVTPREIRSNALWNGWERVPVPKDRIVSGRGPQYSRDPEATEEMEAEIEQCGLGSLYVKALTLLLWPDKPEDEGKGKRTQRFVERGPEGVFRLMRATAEEKCRAALLAVRRSKQ